MNESGVIFLLGVLFTIALVVIGDALDRAQKERIQRIGAERLEKDQSSVTWPASVTWTLSDDSTVTFADGPTYVTEDGGASWKVEP